MAAMAGRDGRTVWQLRWPNIGDGRTLTFLYTRWPMAEHLSDGRWPNDGRGCKAMGVLCTPGIENRLFIPLPLGGRRENYPLAEVHEARWPVLLTRDGRDG